MAVLANLMGFRSGTKLAERRRARAEEWGRRPIQGQPGWRRITARGDSGWDPGSGQAIPVGPSWLPSPSDSSRQRDPAPYLKRLYSNMTYDFCIIGGGIVGLATAGALVQERPGAGVLVLEKETALGQHQTGHNSGVIHAGIYYAPAVSKAELCRRGAQRTKEFCGEHGIPFEVCGKLLVATNTLEHERMETLVECARQNRIEVERLDGADLQRREPQIVGVGALFVKETGIVDYRRVCETMGAVVRQGGGEIQTGVQVTGIRETGSEVTVTSAGGEWKARHLIACAGLQSDRVARLAGLKIDHQIVPFRGEYYRLPAAKSGIVRHLIYPIPDPQLPFLGVHLTPMLDGTLTVGPNAVLGFARGATRNSPSTRKTSPPSRHSRVSGR